ncbi:beta-fructofuranosidase-like protein [Trypanosoma grayi]|uniref:beta-fructofuranosidase-like protein n=1 Tax=Trypanosoma grayi TaxID=71804 RepID=UPI0004F4026F|nr:beta-fructofuranosidase-like protein [Trypanosoma grayi]KEG05883.1 beta-fructofuranosidase-like protein [Trypanosoma grayi]
MQRMTLSTLTLLVLLLLPRRCGALQVSLLSDTHYDPAYGQPNGYGKCVVESPALGVPGCDAPPDLITSVCADMSAQSSAYMFMAGDLQRHQFDESGLTLNDTIGTLTENLAAVNTSGTIEGPRVAIAMGNNDMVPNYYLDAINGRNEFLKDEADIMEKNDLLLPEEAQQFVKCAYYLRTVSPTVRLIVLHTLVWCYSISPAIPDDETDPCGQFDFLNTQLADARKAGAKVIIMSHIPPYINVWGVLDARDFHSIRKDMYWKPVYQQRFNNLMKEYSDTVRVQLYGHTHLFSFQVLPGGVPSFIIPAITPVYGNNPSYFISEFDDNDWSLRSLAQRFLSNTTWSNGLRVEDVFGSLSDTAALQETTHRLLTDDDLWTRFIILRAGGVENHALFPGGACDWWCRKLSVCSMQFATWDELVVCVRQDRAPPGGIVVPVTLVAIFAVFLAVGAGLLIVHRRRQLQRMQRAEFVEVVDVVSQGAASAGERSGEQP